ncbi:PKD domain-containing protein [Shewanella psychrotolerans]|uniref:PKD domain-containing protein n=1 Tax=Shewanella psychrotolerans TaxID=2864206 RepID=UPI001C656227|nr:hypothetical protein [Shewanella psychrotolerans]QYK01955.1 hypothetical protein K0I62_02970 [Shewanella psychrotolerans]
MDFSYKLFILFFTLFGLSACGGSSDKVNSPPIANAGIDQTITERSSITLYGTGSDEDGDIVSYHWSQISGSMVETSSTDITAVSFVTPSVDTEEVIVFELTVTDNEGATASDTVDITITPILFPVNAGEDKTYFNYESFNLNCNPNDTDIGNLNFFWKQLEGPELKLSDTTACSPQLQLSDYDGIYTFELTVSDDYDTNVSTVNISSKKYSGERSQNKYPIPMADWYSTNSAVRQFTYDEPLKSLTSDGQYLYALLSNKLLVLEDNGTEIIEINSYSGEYLQFGFANKHLYLVGSYGIDVIDASNPLSLLLVAQYPITLRASDPFYLSSQYAYIPHNGDVCEMCENEGFDELYDAIDISMPNDPQYIRRFGNTFGVDVNGDYYVWGDCSLVTATAEPVSVWKDDADGCDQFLDADSGWPDSILVNDGAVYRIDDSQSDLRVYDVHNRKLTLSQIHFENFKILSSDQLFGQYMVSGNYYLNSLNIKNPFEPKHFARYKVPDELVSMIEKDDTLYGIDTEGGLIAVDTQLIKLNQVTSNVAEIEVDKALIINYQYTALSEIDGDCRVTSGYCRVEFDKANNMLSVVWQPTDIGEQEMLLYIGNKNYTVSARERVIVIAP